MTHTEEKRQQRREVAQWMQVAAIVIGMTTIAYKVGKRDQQLTELKSIVMTQQASIEAIISMRQLDQKDVQKIDKRVQYLETISTLKTKPQS